MMKIDNFMHYLNLPKVVLLLGIMLSSFQGGGINIFTPVGPEWRLVGPGDVNGDGTDDILWQHINGQVHFWPMRDGARQGGINIFTPVGPEWRLIGAGNVD